MQRTNEAKTWRPRARGADVSAGTEPTGGMKRTTSSTRLRRLAPTVVDEFAGLDRLDRAELDDDSVDSRDRVS